MSKGLLVVNCKNYQQGLGKAAVKLANELKKHKSVLPIICVQPTDISEVKKTGITVFAQHVDANEPGAHTGNILPEAVKAAGAKGTLINHSENRLPHPIIAQTVKRCKALKLKTIVCAKDAKEAKKLAILNPDYIAVEPPELIGGNISVATAKPDLIKSSKKAVGNVKLLVGAGVKNAKDTQISLKLGAKGVLVASGVVKAKNIKSAIKDLVKGLN